jgi:hypothetical protein
VVVLLELGFGDVDVDGAHEVVALGDTMLHIYENGSSVPLSLPRGTESIYVADMVGIAFDDAPGKDVLAWHDAMLEMYASDGLGGLGPAMPVMSPYTAIDGFVAGPFDAESGEDLLIWGIDAAGVLYGSGDVLTLTGDAVDSATARELGLPGNGFTLLQGHQLMFLDLDGLDVGSVVLYGSGPHQQSNFDTMGMPLEIGTSIQVSQPTWTLVEVFDRLTTNQVRRWGVPGTIERVRAGDLDGLDESDELALVIDGTPWLYVADECLLPVPLEGVGVVIDVAFGDHDGDGDDELAVQLEPNRIALVDVE